jgi:ABC-type multidrug transport system fused ATPase/permease subunit
MSSGVLLRGGLIAAIYSRTLRLTSRARSTLTNGKLVNHISTDVSRIDFCCGFFHMSWTAPIQLIICLVLLCLNLGPSALAGFAIFVLATPMQTVAMKKMFAMRRKSMQWTDKRAKLLQELLGGMKVIKFFAWEIPLLKRIFEYRQKEMAYVAPSAPFCVQILTMLLKVHPLTFTPSVSKQCYRIVYAYSRICYCICHLFFDWAQVGSGSRIFFTHFIQLTQAAYDVSACVLYTLEFAVTHLPHSVIVQLHHRCCECVWTSL